MEFKMSDRPFVAITMGDPAGIGAEVTVKALREASVYGKCRPFVVGNAAAIQAASDLAGAGMATRVVQSVDDVRGDAGGVDVLDIENLDYGSIETGRVSEAAGRAAIEWVLEAGKLAKDGRISAIVTAPINKEAASLAGTRTSATWRYSRARPGPKRSPRC